MTWNSANGKLARFQRSAFLHFVVALVVFSASPPFTGLDSFWTVPGALSLLSTGHTNIDEYTSRRPARGSYSMECVPPEGPAVYTGRAPAECPGGHWYNYFPFSVSLFAIPSVVVARPILAGMHWIAAHATALRTLASQHRIIADFLSGDPFAAHALIELWTAAPLAALSVAVEYRILARFLPASQASLLTLLFAFGTAMWSVASRSLLQHGPSVFLLSLALYQLLRAEERAWRMAAAGFLLAAAYTVRPTNAISALVFTIYVAVHARGHFWKFAAGAAAAAVPFFTYNLLVRHALLPAYFQQGPTFTWTEAIPNGLAELVSPSRGLFVFTPVFLVSLFGMWRAIKTRWLFPLTPYLLAILALHAAVTSFWWPGHCYGARYFTDMTFLFVLFLVPALKSWPDMPASLRPAAAGAFVVLGLFGLFVHARGATSVAANAWSATPVSVDDRPSRIWDWSDPQFLRGLPGFPVPH